MKILIATGIYPPHIGGPATYSKLLHDELPKRGIEVSVLSFDTVRHLPKVIRHVVYLGKLISAARACDLIYAQDPVSVGLPALLGSKLLSKPLVVKIVGDYAWEQGTQRFGIHERLDEFSKKKEGYPLFVKITKKVQTLVANKARTVIVPSEYLKKIISQWGVAPEHITVIYNAFDGVDLAMEHVGEVINKHGSARILSVGRLVAWKGFDTLIALMPRVRQRYPESTLTIIGEGPERMRLEHLITECGAHGYVTLVGQKSHIEVLEALKKASVFMLNTFYEGFSHQLLEALALGTPIVTTNVGGNPEIITNNENGILVEYNNTEKLYEALVRVLDSEELQKTFREAGRKKVLEFSQERMVTELIRTLS